MHDKREKAIFRCLAISYAVSFVLRQLMLFDRQAGTEQCLLPKEAFTETMSSILLQYTLLHASKLSQYYYRGDSV